MLIDLNHQHSTQLQNGETDRSIKRKTTDVIIIYQRTNDRLEETTQTDKQHEANEFHFHLTNNHAGLYGIIQMSVRNQSKETDFNGPIDYGRTDDDQNQ